MLEILITLFLLTMWLLASAGVQSSSLQFNKAAQFRTQAVYLATDLAERMQANRTGAIAGNLRRTPGWPPGRPRTDCTCATLLAGSARGVRPGGMERSRRPRPCRTPRSRVSTAAVANPITYTILISWSDRRTDRTYSATGTAESFSYTATKTIFDPPS